MKITATTQYIISTSGRASSIERYRRLLQDILQLDIAYLPITPYAEDGLIKPEHFAQAIKGLGAIGGAISKDIKAKIIPYLDSLDPFAQLVGSVNTVIRDKDILTGYNTDAHGFETAIREGISQSQLKINTALIYGYGGVFNVAYHVLTSLGIEVFLTGRRPEEVVKKNAAYHLTPFDGTPKDLFVNATPITDQPLELATGFLEAVQGSKLVFDHQMPGSYMAAYCKENNIAYIPGTAMYYPQMYRQWALFLKDYVSANQIPSLITQAEKG
ncbi:shikimate dehydrogenase [Rhodocytophaga rosea]|uniref:Shikimate dehydrogenase n=1 Tax=Rhodocytophaga rosea TaxID=2704465 RepID=A0A6C0GQK6_9BACT|nr:shikimate dehydrogenase [Rhodocytophaga rosea]QHT70217.1 shikimate dehydrogenase [Rhodocytophaga rosea]